ncbi:MAG: hypothetical protein SFU56_07855 [Capsulimonadales bacterium]|nr:hypothetical protein [Capsulimonadales bacterium]
MDITKGRRRLAGILSAITLLLLSGCGGMNGWRQETVPDSTADFAALPTGGFGMSETGSTDSGEMATYVPTGFTAGETIDMLPAERKTTILEGTPPTEPAQRFEAILPEAIPAFLVCQLLTDYCRTIPAEFSTQK